MKFREPLRRCVQSELISNDSVTKSHILLSSLLLINKRSCATDPVSSTQRWWPQPPGCGDLFETKQFSTHDIVEEERPVHAGKGGSARLSIWMTPVTEAVQATSKHLMPVHTSVCVWVSMNGVQLKPRRHAWRSTAFVVYVCMLSCAPATGINMIHCV